MNADVGLARIHTSAGKRPIFRRALGVVSFVGALVIMTLWWWNNFGQHRVWQSAFDAVAWKQARPLGTTWPNRSRTVRSCMIEDLLQRYEFDGWTRQQVHDLLGKPAPTVKGTGFEQWDMIYVLGLERSGPFSLDDEALGFEFDSTNRVTKYGLSVN